MIVATLSLVACARPPDVDVDAGDGAQAADAGTDADAGWLPHVATARVPCVDATPPVADPASAVVGDARPWLCFGTTAAPDEDGRFPQMDDDGIFVVRGTPVVEPMIADLDALQVCDTPLGRPTRTFTIRDDAGDLWTFALAYGAPSGVDRTPDDVFAFVGADVVARFELGREMPWPSLVLTDEGGLALFVENGTYLGETDFAVDGLTVERGELRGAESTGWCGTTAPATVAFATADARVELFADQSAALCVDGNALRALVGTSYELLLATCPGNADLSSWLIWRGP